MRNYIYIVFVLMMFCVSGCRGVKSVTATHTQSLQSTESEKVIESVTIKADSLKETKAYVDSLIKEVYKADSVLKESKSRDSMYRGAIHTDTLIHKDSVFVVEHADGSRDTYRQSEIIRNKETHDTIYKLVTSSETDRQIASLTDRMEHFKCYKDSVEHYKAQADSLALMLIRKDSIDREKIEQAKTTEREGLWQQFKGFLAHAVVIGTLLVVFLAAWKLGVFKSIKDTLKDW